MQKEMQKRERNCLPMKKMEERGRLSSIFFMGRQKEMQKEMQHKSKRQIERERERERERSKAQVFCAAKCTLSIFSPRTA